MFDDESCCSRVCDLRPLQPATCMLEELVQLFSIGSMQNMWAAISSSGMLRSSHAPLITLLTKNIDSISTLSAEWRTQIVHGQQQSQRLLFWKTWHGLASKWDEGALRFVLKNLVQRPLGFLLGSI